MRTRVERLGDGLAVRIPESLATEAGLKEDASVEVSLVDGSIVVTPPMRRKRTLEELLAGVTDENLHGEIDFGPPVGKEIW